MEIGVKALQAGRIEAVYCTAGKPAAAGDLLLALRPAAEHDASGIAQLLDAYRAGATDPRKVVEELIARKHEADAFNVWICRVDDARLAQSRRGTGAAVARLTAAVRHPVRHQGQHRLRARCPPRRVARHSATRQPSPRMWCSDWWTQAPWSLGKTNLDQFATGLVGTRSPYGVCRNRFDPAYISGGSSSGSALAVALGQASFALGTDTAGSGRVPAAFNNLVGYKPTLGRLSTRGMVPACLSLDAMSIFASTADDAALVAQDRRRPGPAGSLVAGARRCARSRLVTTRAVPLCRAAGCAARIHGQCRIRAAVRPGRSRTSAKLGGEPVSVDISPLLRMRKAAVPGTVGCRTLPCSPAPDRIQPGGAAAGYARHHRRWRKAHRARCVSRAVPAAGTAPGCRGDMGTGGRCCCCPPHRRISRLTKWRQNPSRATRDLGYYTNFVNLMDLAAVAVPAGFTARGLPFGVSLIGPAWTDDDLLRLAVAHAARP